MSLDCSTKLPKPATLADVRLDGGWNIYSGWYYSEGLPPTPPPYSPNDKFSHCHTWSDWLTTNPNFYTTYPSTYLRAVAGLADQVAITAVEVKLFTAKNFEPNTGSFVQCLHGAGGLPGYIVHVDTLTSKVSLELFPVPGKPQNKGESPMPPASINVKPGDYETTEIIIEGDGSKLYTGELIVTAILNGVERRIEIGSPEVPLRWMGRDRNAANSPATTTNRQHSLDWDLDANSWQPSEVILGN
ncbi:hypothetical protein GCM10027262_23260 [Nocardia tengchongensis]